MPRKSKNLNSSRSCWYNNSDLFLIQGQCKGGEFVNLWYETLTWSFLFAEGGGLPWHALLLSKDLWQVLPRLPYRWELWDYDCGWPVQNSTWALLIPGFLLANTPCLGKAFFSFQDHKGKPRRSWFICWKALLMKDIFPVFASDISFTKWNFSRLILIG